MVNDKPLSPRKVVDRSMPPPPLPKRRLEVLEDSPTSSTQGADPASQTAKRQQHTQSAEREPNNDYRSLPINRSGRRDDISPRITGAAVSNGPRLVTWNTSTKRPLTFSDLTELSYEQRTASLTSKHLGTKDARLPMLGAHRQASAEQLKQTFSTPSPLEKAPAVRGSVEFYFPRKSVDALSSSQGRASEKPLGNASLQNVYHKQDAIKKELLMSDPQDSSMMQQPFDSSTPLTAKQLSTAFYMPNAEASRSSRQPLGQIPLSSRPSTQSTPPPSTPDADKKHNDSFQSPGSPDSNTSTVPNSPPDLPKQLEISTVDLRSLKSGSDEGNGGTSQTDFLLQLSSSASSQATDRLDSPPRAPEVVMAEAAARRAFVIPGPGWADPTIGTAISPQSIAQSSLPEKTLPSMIGSHASRARGGQAKSIAVSKLGNLNTDPSSPEIGRSQQAETSTKVLHAGDEAASGRKVFLGYKGLKEVDGIHEWMLEISPSVENDEEEN